MTNRPDVKSGEPVRASFETSVKANEGESRSLSFVISSARIDRAGDTISVEGWKLDSYRKNPVVLWAHDATMLPVGRATTIEIDGGKLKAVAEFTPAGMSRFNDTVYEMYKGGFLSATSVGFMPIKFAFTEDATRKLGINFMEQELLEFSAVPVPANVDALIEARSMLGRQCMDEFIKLSVGGSDGIMRLAETYVEKGDLLAWAELLIEESYKDSEPVIVAANAQRFYAQRQRERRAKAIRLTAK